MWPGCNIFGQTTFACRRPEAEVSFGKHPYCNHGAAHGFLYMKTVFWRCLVLELLATGFPGLGTAQVCRDSVCFPQGTGWRAPEPEHGELQCPQLCQECAAGSQNSLTPALCRVAGEFVICYWIFWMFWHYSTVKEVFSVSKFYK